MRIGLVGPCKSGKSELKHALQEHGFVVRHIAQEHSFAPKMWKTIGKPDVLIYLDVSFENTVIRGKLNWNQADYNAQLKRLENARSHADLYIDTNKLSVEQVIDTALEFINGFK